MLLVKLAKLHARLAALGRRGRIRRRLIRQRIMRSYFSAFLEANPYAESEIYVLVQNITFPLPITSPKKLMVFLVPEHNAMSGGIYSIFSIAHQMRRLKHVHRYDVMIATLSRASGLTYFRNTNFLNSENVYRFEQICLCDAVEDLYLHIPEYATRFFLEELPPHVRTYISERKNVYINILNQNIWLMPEKEEFANLREISGEISQSVAHHAYAGQEFADKYALPTLLLPAYTDLSDYPFIPFEEKERLIIYSPDDAPHKAKCLANIRRALPDFELLEIKDITFEKYMDLATRCMFSVSFGEGLDGYISQPFMKGGVGFTVHNLDFFPKSPDFRGLYSIFESEKEMVREVADRMKHLAGNAEAYRETGDQFRALHDSMYSEIDYIEQIRKLAMREFEVLPTRSTIS